MARPFSSALSVAEAFVVREAGFTPIAQVMGSCFYQVGWQSMPLGAARLDGVAARGRHLRARDPDRRVERRALARPQPPARRGGGRRGRRGGRHAPAAAAATTGPPALVEFVAIGTAVRSERYEIEDAPVLSHLSGQDFAKLVRHGFWPVGLVAGSTVAYVVAGCGAAVALVGALLRAPEPGAARLHARHVRRAGAGHGARHPRGPRSCTPTASSASRSSAASRRATATPAA